MAAIRYVTKFLIRTKMHLAITMPWTMVDRPGSVKTMSAAALAASVAAVDTVYCAMCYEVWWSGLVECGVWWRLIFV